MNANTGSKSFLDNVKSDNSINEETPKSQPRKAKSFKMDIFANQRKNEKKVSVQAVIHPSFVRQLEMIEQKTRNSKSSIIEKIIAKFLIEEGYDIPENVLQQYKASLGL